MTITIGELSKQAQVKIPTIRYYETIGLMPAVSRTEGNRRSYERSAVDRLRFIRHARDLGFEVEAIRDLLHLTEVPNSSCVEADAIARAHLIEVEKRISQLQALQVELKRMIGECHHDKVVNCRVISVLADHGLCQSPRHQPTEIPKHFLNNNGPLKAR
ncbi:helix-turn-helix domain-containing protein [Rhizobium sp. CG5]|uniref:MerR family transcriptional regulator n=1 Tax=Rhizobium sp. CG5 TaxID=2726076 RepID=UPI002033BFEE|nr:helix-turn-helix domain-containing protein [Rhizobium sp. CG5]MCM2477286.1 helix-turn-helix domain-containing protein [Rhizobium sp. CG5]